MIREYVLIVTEDEETRTYVTQTYFAGKGLVSPTCATMDASVSIVVRELATLRRAAAKGAL